MVPKDRPTDMEETLGEQQRRKAFEELAKKVIYYGIAADACPMESEEDVVEERVTDQQEQEHHDGVTIASVDELNEPQEGEHEGFVARVAHFLYSWPLFASSSSPPETLHLLWAWEYPLFFPSSFALFVSLHCLFDSS